MKILQGDTKPKAEQKHLYQLNTIIPAITSNVFSPTKIDAKYTWTLYRFVNNQWQQVKKNIKYGEKNEYLFGQGVVGIPFKIMIHSEEKNILQITENKLIAELTVVPRTAKEPVIGRVILLNKSNTDVNKAKFNESLTAQARTSNLLGKDITFYLWEEGTSELEKYKKPKKGTVNKHGIAEVKFNLSEYASPQTWMSFFQPNSNATKKFYVSAVYEDKKATNKTPVTATNGQPQTPRTQQPTNTPPTNNQPQNQNQGSGILSVTRNIIAEGLGSIFNAVENAISPAQVNPQPQTQAQTQGCQSCKISLTVNDLDKFMTAAGHGSIINRAPYNTRIPAYISYLNQYMTLFEINKNCYRRANFLGQVAKETKFWSYKEDFIYSATGLLDLKNFKSTEGRTRANEWGYTNNKSEVTKEREIKIGNWAYGRSPKRSDLGNNECPLNKLNDPEQDGYKYRGRGLIQLTGRTNYTNFQTWYNNNRTKLGLPVVDFITNPDMIFEPQYIVLSAIYFWNANNLNEKADNGVDRSHVLSITNVVNSGEAQAKKDIRYDYVKAAYAMLQEKANDCPLTGKKESESQNSDWHDPVDNPICTLYMQGGGGGELGKIWGLFGQEIRKEVGRPHTGLDCFATTGTDVYACVDSTVYNRRWHGGYGNTITLKVKDPKAFMRLKKQYTLQSTREQNHGSNWNEDGDIYLFYAHLDSVNEYEYDEEIKCGTKIAKSGRSGVPGGTCAPHLHFEIMCQYRMQTGTSYRINPAFFVKYKTYNEQSTTEKNKQEQEKNRGKINQLNGSGKLPERNIF